VWRDAQVGFPAAKLLKSLDGARSRRSPLPGIALAPGKHRLTLRKLGSTLRLGDRVPLTLIVRGVTGVTQEIDVDAEVRLHSPTYDHHVPHTHAKPG
jgi:hypothetical protein